MSMNEGSAPQNLKEQLSLAVRKIQWSYAILWSMSSTQPGVLEWGEGYYNGDIKTRKTIQSVECNTEELGLQRSEQLRQLYDSLSAGESSPHCRRPSAALSPEDLSNTEWYYLVCMSFVFDFGQCLPGRTLATGKHFWLCNAQSADGKIFTRSLLAKSASIQTIVCVPFFGGVIELGTTEQVLEDLGTIQTIKDSYLEIPCFVSFKKHDRDTHQISTVDLVPVLPRLDIASSNVELGNSTLFSTTDHLVYESVISSLVNSQNQFVSCPHSVQHESSFVNWKNGRSLNLRKTRPLKSQKLLKRLLFDVPKMHRVESQKDDPEIIEQFQVLNSILPSTNKVDEVSVLDNTINHLKKLKKRVNDLVASEQTSDNHEFVNTTPTRTKRKIRDPDDTSSLAVSVIGKVFQIDVKCIWREGLLLEIVEALRSLHLDSHTFQSWTLDGVLFLHMKCKLCGSLIGSAELIQKNLKNVIQRKRGRCTVNFSMQ